MCALNPAYARAVAVNAAAVGAFRYLAALAHALVVLLGLCLCVTWVLIGCYACIEVRSNLNDRGAESRPLMLNHGSRLTSYTRSVLGTAMAAADKHARAKHSASLVVNAACL